MAAPLAITIGEPAGIGPDLCLSLAADPPPEVPLVLIGDRALLAERAALLGLEVVLPEHDDAHPAPVSLHHVPLPVPVEAGRADPANARAVLATLDAAADGCLAGRYAGMVTAPVNKAVIAGAGLPFIGHTEYLAERCGGEPVMMLTAGELRVALVTTHLPLSEVPAAITADRLTRVISGLVAGLQRAGTAEPRILVLGLNPHAGEHGHLGQEEQTVIIPTLEVLRSQGSQLTGPVPADTAFTPAMLDGHDAVLAMYHDQGLPALKQAGFGRAVNVTLGLPIVRTSVDHGTALELAGTGRADASSLREAVRVARALAS